MGKWVDEYISWWVEDYSWPVRRGATMEMRNSNIEMRRRPFGIKGWLILRHTIQCEV
jgi:hypothetical protein